MLPKVYHIIFDVDGVFTDGTFFYDSHGKCLKRFGPHDSDGIKMLRSANFSIEAITADKRGFSISKARMEDMEIPLRLVSEKDRIEYIAHHTHRNFLCFMADGHHDALAFKYAQYAIAPQNAVPAAKRNAHYVTTNGGGHGAVYEAALHLIERKS